jgi:hypothetical protein
MAPMRNTKPLKSAVCDLQDIALEGFICSMTAKE